MKFLKNDLSIKKLTLLIFIIMYVLFFIVTTLNLYSYSEYEFAKTEKLIKNFNISLTKQINQKIDTVLDVSKYPLIIPEIDTVNKILQSDKPYSIDEYNYLLYLCDMMLIQNESVNGAYIYNLTGTGVYTSRNNSNDILKNPSLEKWFIDAVNSPSQTSVTDNIDVSNIFKYTDSSDTKLIAITRKIIDLKTQKITGILLLTLPTDSILSLLKSDIPFNNQVISLYNSSGNLITSTDPNKTLDQYQKYIDKINPSPNIEYINDNLQHIICYNNLLPYKWTLITSIPKNDAYHISSLYIILFVSNLIFCLILFIIIYIFFLRRIFQPIEHLIENMSSRIEKNLSYSFKYNRNDEIGILVNSYNDMKNRIHNLININYKNKIEQKELELKQLQNQINPHFIYNTLESIHMMAEINDDPETSTMAEYFGTIIRYSMNRRINTVKLKEEIAIIENYIYLQRIRFDTLFTIENLVNDDVLECEIIKMIIQPLIENSIYHGLSECSGDGKIIIQALHIDNNLVITISDNGIGIEEKRLRSLNDYINGKNESFNGIALRNINRRLKLHYGNDYGLEVFSVLGKGTSMTLTLPYLIN
ncbi:sensor histidine kinase [Clostridium neonatale]|uniref:histidine kinase n=1 Tax=Clostridium neonatale TaxID=137838 RepID=A0A2A7MDV6_9CLOT|nr:MULTISPECIES: sensor histidine kinase [Clostridium]MDU4478099.1 histidine kinase [Clostridium sp.]PEG26066.1 sensor histidine kinase [Clostridium neonatale]PEG29836.1 sensor histidine kinase [Clostridium neonatale]CAH0435657.1 Putative two-component sensor histidine kinase [Clostridium neonatale]CAI3229413.1 putative two-component sensor histidine kinase [Clostridium neonatale]